MENKKKSICEESVFDQIYRDQLKGLFNFLYYKSGNSELAEDISQEAFLKLWENCNQVVFAAAKSFLFTVARNTLINKIQRKKVVLKFKNQLDAKHETQNPSFLLEQKEFHQQLMDTINRLPDNQKEVFLLNRVDQLKYREIAELLGISQKAVEKRMHKALITLRKLHQKI